MNSFLKENWFKLIALLMIGLITFFCMVTYIFVDKRLCYQAAEEQVQKSGKVIIDPSSDDPLHLFD